MNTLKNLSLPICADADCNFTRFEFSWSTLDKQLLAGTCSYNGLGWNRDGIQLPVGHQGDVGKHLWFQFQIAVIHFQSNFDRTRFCLKVGVDIGDLAFECLTRNAGDTHLAMSPSFTHGMSSS